MAKKLPTVHPGEILLTDFLQEFGISRARLAREIGVPARRVGDIVNGRRRITANDAMRLARYFGTSERFWMNLQAHYDLETERDRVGNSLQDEVHVLNAD